MSEQSREFLVEEKNSGERIDSFIVKQLPLGSRSQIQKLISAGKVFLNKEQVKKNERIKAGDRISVHSTGAIDNRSILLDPQEMPIEVLFEDEYLVVINKPAGLVVHPGNGNKSGTLVNGLLYKIGKLSTGTDMQRPGIVHRLDKDTSGVMVVAKSDAAHLALSSAFANRAITKEYIGICIGRPGEDHGMITGALERSRREPIKRTVSLTGKPSQTEFWIIHSQSGISVIRFKPHTGRTHQIRVHCSSRGFPILADTLYGGGKERLMSIAPLDRPFAYTIYKCFDRHALHARALSFIHPFTKNEITFKAPIPEDFQCAAKVFGITDLFDK